MPNALTCWAIRARHLLPHVLNSGGIDIFLKCRLASVYIPMTKIRRSLSWEYLYVERRSLYWKLATDLTLFSRRGSFLRRRYGDSFCSKFSLCLRGNANYRDLKASVNLGDSNSVSKIDRASRILFPAAFLMFNTFYWRTYLADLQSLTTYWKILLPNGQSHHARFQIALSLEKDERTNTKETKWLHDYRHSSWASFV